MKVCMVFYDMQEIGGLEEYAVTLAISLQEKGHPVSVFSAMWVPPTNQYLRRLRSHGVPVIQWPRRVSYPVSDWPTKEKILAVMMGLLGPLVYLLAAGHFMVKRGSWRGSRNSARNWLQGQLMSHLIGPDRRKALARLLLSWWRFRWRPDILHIQGYTTNLLFAIEWAHGRGLPVVYEEHQTPDAQFDWWQGFQESINKASIVVAVSETSAEALKEVCAVTRPIVVRSPLLADPVASGWRREARSANGREPLHVTTVARLGVTKGLTYLLDAVVQIKNIYPATQFRVYGEGELREELLAYANRLGLDGDAIFVGPFTDRSELSRIMTETDVFLMSSILEGKPLGVVEAMAYSCPIVATSVGGIPELIEDGVNGLLCEPKDPDCLAHKTIAMIEDADLRARLGHAARRAYEQGPFQPAAVSEHFVAIYREAMQK